MTTRLAILSMHTSPLAQPGTGDGGGMNVYVRELSSALARSGAACEVFTRAEDPIDPPTLIVEPGLRVHRVVAGPLTPVAKEDLPDLVEEWTSGVAKRLEALSAGGAEVDAIHANYWLSGLAGHSLKHELDVPLLVTFHTLDRVKAESSPEELSAAEPALRALAEAEIVGCADAVLASCSVEAEQLKTLYGADPDRICIVAPGVDHAFFSPGDQVQARLAAGLDPSVPVVLFVGRIQPLKGLAVAVDAVAEIRRRHKGERLGSAALVVIGGLSGPHGPEEMDRVESRIAAGGLHQAVKLLPPQSHSMLSTYYRAADVCVVPSHSESFGLVALEAAACGCPVVAAAVGGLTTLVEHGRTGFLVEGRSPEAFASSIEALLADRDLARRLGAAGARRASAYTWAAAAVALRRRSEQLRSVALVACG